MTYVIDHEAYGPDATEFDSLEQAQFALRACGNDFAETTLDVFANVIQNERGQIVGYVEDK